MNFNLKPDTKETVLALSLSGIIIVSFYLIISNINILCNISCASSICFWNYYCFYTYTIKKFDRREIVEKI